MANEPRDKTLAEYLGILRRRKGIIALTAVACVALALVVSLLLKPTYQAQASLSVQDPNAALALTGAGVASTETPLQLALAHASQVTREEVLRRVDARLHLSLSATQLEHHVSVSVNPNSALVDVGASWPTATGAAAVANAVAREDASLTTAQVRHGYAVEAGQLAKKLLRGPAAADAGTRAINLTQLARLQTLSTVATPVQVDAIASVPTGASSPRPIRYVLAALIFGLLLGVALAYGRDALDRRLREPTDVEALLEQPVVGIVRGEALGRTFGGRNGTATLSPEDEEPFRVMRQNVRYLTPDPLRSMLVTSAMPSEGKTTVAICLAAATAAAGKRTLLVECDLRRPTLAARLGLRTVPGLTDYLTQHADWKEVACSVPTLDHGARNGRAAPDSVAGYTAAGPLNCITAGSHAPRPTELLGSERFRKFLVEVCEVYDAVIIDSAPLLSAADTLEIVPLVEGILICVRLRQTTREQASGLRAALERLPQRPTGLILTGVQKTEPGYYGYYGHYRAGDPRSEPAQPRA